MRSPVIRLVDELIADAHQAVSRSRGMLLLELVSGVRRGEIDLETVEAYLEGKIGKSKKQEQGDL